MRLWIFVIIMIWGLIACSSGGTPPLPPPTGSPVELTVDDVEVELVTTTGWQTYATQDRITISYEENTPQDIVVNIWIPNINIASYETITDAAFDVANMMENEQDIRVSQPVAVNWQGYEAAYFLVSNDEPQTSMIIVADVTGDRAIALNIRGVVADFSSIRGQLTQTFETFTINDRRLGSDFFLMLPDTLILPSMNPEAALDPSAEP